MDQVSEDFSVAHRADTEDVDRAHREHPGAISEVCRYHRGMTMLTEEPVAQSSPDVSAAVCLFRSLADPARLAIVRHLALGEYRVVDLTAHLGLAQSTVSAHLACLRDCGLVTSRPQGRASLFALARPELFDLFAAAERVLAATGASVLLCPVYGEDSDR